MQPHAAASCSTPCHAVGRRKLESCGPLRLQRPSKPRASGFESKKSSNVQSAGGGPTSGSRHRGEEGRSYHFFGPRAMSRGCLAGTGCCSGQRANCEKKRNCGREGSSSIQNPYKPHSAAFAASRHSGHLLGHQTPPSFNSLILFAWAKSSPLGGRRGGMRTQPQGNPKCEPRQRASRGVKFSAALMRTFRDPSTHRGSTPRAPQSMIGDGHVHFSPRVSMSKPIS